ncbi:MAG TPA: hypothetical protein PK975_05560 [Candidatus Hydrogenedentes bacterium]|nr:hypothetical protein [Candidatus Hydrogenedentota bacterium]
MRRHASMSKQKVGGRFFLSGFLALVLLCPLCLGAPPRGQLQDLVTFQGDGFSLTYPSSWLPLNEIWETYQFREDPFLHAQEIWGVADPGSRTRWEKYTTAVHVLRRQMPTGQTLRDVFHATYAAMPESCAVLYESESELHGLPVLEKSYKRPRGESWYQFRDIWINKGGTIYIISCQVLPQGFQDANRAFSVILSSFFFGEPPSQEEHSGNGASQPPRLEDIPDGRDVSVGGAPPEYTFRSLWKRALVGAQQWEPDAYLVYACGEYLNDQGVPSSWTIVFCSRKAKKAWLCLTIDPWGKISDTSKGTGSPPGVLEYASEALAAARPVPADLLDSDMLSKRAMKAVEERFGIASPWDPKTIVLWDKNQSRAVWIYRFRTAKGDAFKELRFDARTGAALKNP